MKRELVQSGASWESLVGYSRAVRVGNVVHVSGTTATDADGQLIGAGDAYAQTRQALANIETALQRAGVSVEHVTRTRMFVTDIARWEDIARAHSEYFDKVRPAATMVEVRRLIHPDMLIEIEADAIVHGPTES